MFNRRTMVLGALSMGAGVGVAKAGSAALDAGQQGVRQSNSDSVNRAYLQQMLDALGEKGGGSLTIPAVNDGGFLGVDGVLRVHDNTMIQGASNQSHLRCTVPAGKTAGLSYLFDCGNYRAVDLTTEKSWHCSPIVEGSRVVRLNGASDFQPGDIVWAFSQRPTEARIKSALQFNEVIAVSRGHITVSHPWAQNISDPRLAKSSGQLLDPIGNARRATKRVGFRNLHLSTEANNASWNAAGGCLEATFESLQIESRSPFYSNAFAYCHFKNVRGTFGDRFVELAGYSHDTVIEDAGGTFQDRGIAPTREPLISFGENSNRNRLSRFVLNADDCREASLYRARDGSDNIVEDGVANVRNLTGALLSVRPSAGRCHDNIVRRLEIHCGAATNAVDWAPSSRADEGANLFEDIQIHGRLRGASMMGRGLLARRVMINGAVPQITNGLRQRQRER